ncbi:MAG: RNA methyltransferase [Alphaproteobacteria bacterium RIFOXYD12_FULL_60_8]|nr:MAG: RNA methyltransferase [Alphaproteobacteria bacterium RIFOXYD12_FULL_60_8]
MSVRAAAPVVVLVQPQLAENMGMVARAMLNFGLHQLRVVSPKQAPSMPKGVSAAVGAAWILEEAEGFQTTAEAVPDCHRIYATTARRRDLVKPVLSPQAAAVEMRALIDGGGRAAILFGRESSGLDNDDIALADAVIEIPANPEFTSFNLAQAVLLVAYEWFKIGMEVSEGEPVRELVRNDSPPATKEELHNFYRHLESELDACGFLRNLKQRPSMVRNLRSLFNRADLSEQEVRTLHGVVKELRWGRRPDRTYKHPKPEDD